MKKVLHSFLFIISLFYLLSCAQEPNAVIAAKGGGDSSGYDPLNPGDAITKNAVIFKGSDLFGTSCELALSVMEEDGGHVFLTKLNYVLHGENMPATEARLYKFDHRTGRYSGPNSRGGDHLKFGGLILNSNQDPDINLLRSYESTGALVYALIVEIDENFAYSAKIYEEALETVVSDTAQLSTYTPVLNKISRVVFKKAHVGHYDASSCDGFKLDSVRAVTFEIGHHDDDDDHDHDDDDHDHGDHDDHDDHDHDDHDDHDHGDHDDHDHGHNSRDHHEDDNDTESI